MNSRYRMVHGTTDLPDAAVFIEILDTLDQSPTPALRVFFDREGDLFVTRAPGRLDVMGGIADYSGSLVLELPIQEATFVAVQRDPQRMITIASLSEDAAQNLLFEMSLSDFENAGGALEYDVAREYFQSDTRKHWAAYVAGVFLVLMRERGTSFDAGARILICSQVPQGKGVSSSAALEVAVMQAVAAAFDIRIEGRELALLCQKVENLVVGAPCGVMDQLTSSCGERNRLLALLCQPAELRELIPIPNEIGLWGIDSGIRHSVSGADYGSVRVGTFIGYRIMAELAGLKIVETISGGGVRIDDPRWGGYLANVTPAEFVSYAEHLPQRMDGAEFLARYQGTTDQVARVEPERDYAVRIPTAHAVYEHERVRRYAGLVAGRMSEQQLSRMGELMFQSHESYSACGLNSEGTDLLVTLVREAGPGQGLFGAKITGGGSGGTVAILGKRDAGAGIIEVAERYARKTGQQPWIFAGSSPGSEAFGYLRLRK
jgi:galactokinase